MPVAARADGAPAIPSTYVGRLTTVADWMRQISKIYREMRRHQIAPDFGTKLTYVANVGATLARFIEERPPLVVAGGEYDLSQLDVAELGQLEALLAKAAGPEAQRLIASSVAPARDDGAEDAE